MKEDNIIIKLTIIIAVILVFTQHLLYLINYFGINQFNYLFWGLVHFKEPSLNILIYSIIVIIITILIAVFRTPDKVCSVFKRL